MKTDPRVEDYILRAAPFAQPILRHLRALVHEACPETHETIKWSMPHFVIGDAILCHMAAFKAHCAFGFWRPEMGELIAAEGVNADGAMGSLGRITTTADLPSDANLRRYLHAAARLLDQPLPKRGQTKKKSVELPVPDDLAEAFRAMPAAGRNFAGFSPSQRKEYVEWILGAKRAETRAKRIATMIEQVAEGKTLHWRYQ
jgi:uncharacterized protein YdeI (YjbR/CyaY-like superfamily)